jgi:hypothetical protein
MLEKMEKMSKELEKRDTLVEKAEVRAIEAEKLARQLSQVDVVNVEMATQPHSSELASAVSQVHSNNHLDVAPITPLLLRESPPLPYNNPADDDIYMGDSESDIQQKERGNRKAVKKRRNQQREENSDVGSDKDRLVEEGLDFDDDSDNETYKRKRKAVKKGKARQREENSEGGSDEDRMVEEVLDFDDNSDDESYKRKRKAVKKGNARQREENSEGGSDEDRMVEQRVIFAEDDEDYQVVDTDMASPLN